MIRLGKLATMPDSVIRHLDLQRPGAGNEPSSQVPPQKVQAAPGLPVQGRANELHVVDKQNLGLSGRSSRQATHGET